MLGKWYSRLQYWIQKADADLSQVTDDSLLAHVLAPDGDVSEFDDTKHSLKALADDIYEEHTHARILFITPEAVASISDDNTAIKTELEKLCTVDHIVQTDALNFPNFTIYSLCVLGSNSDTAWDTANLADIKTVPQIPILCFDKVAAAYLEMGTAIADGTSKTAMDVTAKIEASVLGMGSYYKGITGLAAGSNTIMASGTIHKITMANTNITEVVYASDTVDIDTAGANADVVLGFIPGVLEDGTIGVDEAGDEIPATLAFFGAGYEADKLTTLGLAVIYLTCHILIHAQKVPAEIAGIINNLRKKVFGNMQGSFAVTTPMVEWLCGQNSVGNPPPAGVSLYDILYMMRGLVYVGAVTTATGVTAFSVLSLAGLGTNFFKPTAGAAYEILVIKTHDGGAPLGEQTPVTAYTTGTGAITHVTFTSQLAVDDVVAIIHPLIASLGTKATAAAAGAVTTADYLMAYMKQLVTAVRAIFEVASADLSAVTNDSPLAHIFAKDGDVSDFDDNLHSLEALYDKMVALQGGSETLESLDDELDAILDLDEVVTIASPVTLTASVQYIYSNAPGTDFYFAGGFVGRATGGWANSEAVTINVEVKIDGSNWVEIWTKSYTVEPTPVLVAVPSEDPDDVLKDFPHGFYNNGGGVRVGIVQTTVGAGYHTWNHSFHDAVRSS